MEAFNHKDAISQIIRWYMHRYGMSKENAIKNIRRDAQFEKEEHKVFVYKREGEE